MNRMIANNKDTTIKSHLGHLHLSRVKRTSQPATKSGTHPQIAHEHQLPKNGVMRPWKITAKPSMHPGTMLYHLHGCLAF